MGVESFTDEELQGLEGLSQEQLIALETTFDGLVRTMGIGVERDKVVGLAHQSHHLGYDYSLMEQLAGDERTLARAEAELRQREPDSLYFAINA